MKLNVAIAGSRLSPQLRNVRVFGLQALLPDKQVGNDYIGRRNENQHDSRQCGHRRRMVV
jgi:hypothetical protein